MELTNQIDWSWIWATSPLWIPYAIFGIFVVSGIIITSLAILINAIFDKKT